MTEEEIKKLNEVTSRYSREHMFRMRRKRKSIIENKMADIAAGELETEAFLAQEKLKNLINGYVDSEIGNEIKFSLSNLKNSRI